MSDTLDTILIPKEWRECFELTELTEKDKEMSMVLTEKEECTPAFPEGAEHVLNGYMDPIEIIDFPLRGKLMYITFIRRRWKLKGENRSHFNTYTFHRLGMKTANEFGDFLKGLDRKKFDEFCRVWPVLENLR